MDPQFLHRWSVLEHLLLVSNFIPAGPRQKAMPECLVSAASIFRGANLGTKKVNVSSGKRAPAQNRKGRTVLELHDALKRTENPSYRTRKVPAERLARDNACSGSFYMLQDVN